MYSSKEFALGEHRDIKAPCLPHSLFLISTLVTSFQHLQSSWLHRASIISVKQDL